MESAKASYERAMAELDMARIDLERTQVVAPADGTISNLHLRQGNYVNKGTAVLSEVIANSFYVTGYFEETKLQLVQVGQPARMTMMGADRTLTGTVVSISPGIADTNTSSNEQMLPRVQQTSNWVRLAQRIPVNIALDPLYLNVILTCLRSSDDSFVAYTVDVGFGRYDPRPAVIYDKPYGSIGYGQSMEFISSKVRENVEAVLTDYLSVNFNL